MNENYIPLYRKYRPQRLEEIVGQENVKRALKNAIETNRISHAYLFTGPRGTGKTSTARIFAKSLNCVNGPTISPCNECENCKNITNSIPIDVIEIDAASNRSVNDADEIIQKVAIAPVSSRYKIYIIDEVHMLTTQAFNALLKTLEEPPKNVIFILATTEVHKVLDTIKSRCQRFDFRRITTGDIVKHLRYISDKEGFNITDDALFTIAKNSAGGMRDSIALLDQLSILDGEKAISTDDINNLLGRISFDVLKELCDAIIASSPQIAIEVLEKIYNSGNEPTQILNNLLDYFKNLLIVKNCNPEIVFELTQLNEAQIKELGEQVNTLETHQITALIDKISDYIKEVKTTNNPRLWLEVGIIDLANLTENTTLADLQNRLIKLEGGVVQPVAASAPIDTKKIKEQFIEKYKPAESSSQKSVKAEEKQTSETKSVETVTQQEKPEVKPETKPEVKREEVPQEDKQDDFSPMPKAKPVFTDDIASLWAEVLKNVSSPPTRALLKQWANPVKITPEETIISLKNEMLLNQFVSGNKKAVLEAAVGAVLNQSTPKLIVRLPMPEDEVVKVSATQPQAPKPVGVPKPSPSVEDITPEDEEVLAALDEAKKAKEPETEPSYEKKSHAAGHSDQVNMVVDLFDGKIIE